MISQLQSAAKPEVIYPDSDGKPIANNTKRSRAEQIERQLEQERLRSQTLAEGLRAMGIDPDQV